MSLVRLTRCYLLGVALVLCSSACSDGSRSTPEELPDEVSAPIGAKGGTLRAPGVTLDIPAGALDKTIKITAANVGMNAPKELNTKQLSDTYQFGPKGTQFKKDVTVTFPNKTEEPRAEVYFTKESGDGFEPIKSERRGDEVLAKVKHFSQGFLGVPLEPEEDAGETTPAADAGTPDPEPMDASFPLDSGASMDASAPDSGTQASDAGSADAAAADSALPTTHIVVHTRDVYGALVNQTWAAIQDGTGGWRVLAAPTQTGVYEFDVVNSVFAVALVCSSADQANSWGTLRYATTASATLELGTPGSVCTTGTPPAKHTLSGVVRMPSGYWYWRYGHAHQSSGVLSTAGATTTPSFSLTELVHDELNDVLFTTAPGTSSYVIGKIAIRRDVRPTADADAGVDFDLVDGGLAPQGSAQVQMLGASGDAGTIDVHYLTRATEMGLWLNTSPTSGAGTLTATFATLPESIRLSTDRYFARGAEELATQWRRASVATYPSGPLTLTLPPAFATTFGALGTPYLRPTFRFTPVANAREYLFHVMHSATANSNHRFEIELEPAWLQGTGEALLTFPDFSVLPGFNTSWVALSTATVSATAAVRTSSVAGQITLKSESGQSATVGPL